MKIWNTTIENLKIEKRLKLFKIPSVRRLRDRRCRRGDRLLQLAESRLVLLRSLHPKLVSQCFQRHSVGGYRFHMRWLHIIF